MFGENEEQNLSWKKHVRQHAEDGWAHVCFPSSRVESHVALPRLEHGRDDQDGERRLCVPRAALSCSVRIRVGSDPRRWFLRLKFLHRAIGRRQARRLCVSLWAGLVWANLLPVMPCHCVLLCLSCLCQPINVWARNWTSHPQTGAFETLNMTMYSSCLFAGDLLWLVPCSFDGGEHMPGKIVWWEQTAESESEGSMLRCTTEDRLIDWWLLHLEPRKSLLARSRWWKRRKVVGVAVFSCLFPWYWNAVKQLA